MNIYGAGGHAKVIIDIIHSRNKEVSYIFDDDRTIAEILGYKVNHNPSVEMRKEIFTVIGIGDNHLRKKIAALLGVKMSDPIFHISAVLSPSAIVGKGTVVMANATINAEASIGEHCIINTGAVIEHDVQLDHFVHISPNASIAGNVTIGEGTHVGIGASIIPGISIGKWVVVGAGSVIVEDIPDFSTVVGIPGKIIKSKK